jgi:hypothetical protein
LNVTEISSLPLIIIGVADARWTLVLFSVPSVVLAILRTAHRRRGALPQPTYDRPARAHQAGDDYRLRRRLLRTRATPGPCYEGGTT